MPPVPPPPPPPPPVDPNALQFARDILPILERHCTECHHQGRISDFTDLSTWTDPVRTVERILAAAETIMPPSPREKLSADELDLIRLWRDQGMNP